jgi:hypothetical protein
MIGAKSKLIAIGYYEHFKKEWLNYPEHYYINTKPNTLIYTELLKCNSAVKSLELSKCFKMSALSDFNKHIIQNNVYWRLIKEFDIKYKTSLYKMLKSLIDCNTIIMFLPEF